MNFFSLSVRPRFAALALAINSLVLGGIVGFPNQMNFDTWIGRTTANTVTVGATGGTTTIAKTGTGDLTIGPNSTNSVFQIATGSAGGVRTVYTGFDLNGIHFGNGAHILDGPSTTSLDLRAGAAQLAQLCGNNGTDCFSAFNGSLQATKGGFTQIDMSSNTYPNFPNAMALQGHKVVTCAATYDPPAPAANQTVSTGGITCTGVTSTMRCAAAGNVTTTTINIGGQPTGADTITMYAQCVNGASACADLASASYQMLCWN